MTAMLKTAIDALDTIRSQAPENGGSHREQALFYRDQIVPAMNKVREAADILEIIVEDQLWPIPKYRELMFMY